MGRHYVSKQTLIRQTEPKEVVWEFGGFRYLQEAYESLLENRR